MTDFAPGDVVVCVDVDTPNFDGLRPPNLGLGRNYRVTGVYAGNTGIGLTLRGVSPAFGRLGFHAFRFRKLKAADEQFTEQMRALRPVPATLSRSSENRNG